MKNFLRGMLCCMVILLGVWVFIHRRVIAALIFGGEMPEAPSWHFWCKRRKSCGGCDPKPADPSPAA